MSPGAKARLRLGLVVVVALIVQTTLGSDLRFERVAPDLMLLLAVCGGIVGGAEIGAVVGFSAGLLADLTLTTTPLGLTALSWCLVGWGVGSLRTNFLPEGRGLQPAIGFLATIGGVGVFLVVGDMVGQAQLIAPGRSYLLRVMLIEGLWNAALAVPVAALLAWAASGLAGADRLGRREAAVLR